MDHGRTQDPEPLAAMWVQCLHPLVVRMASSLNLDVSLSAGHECRGQIGAGRSGGISELPQVVFHVATMPARSEVGSHFPRVRPVSQGCLIDTQKLASSADTDPLGVGIRLWCGWRGIYQNLLISCDRVLIRAYSYRAGSSRTGNYEWLADAPARIAPIQCVYFSRVVAQVDRRRRCSLIGEILRDRVSSVEVLYLGTVNGPERALVEASGFQYEGIPAGKLRRYFSLFPISGT